MSVQTETLRAPRTQSHLGTLSTDTMPGHWVLAALGKTVLRPGGIELTRRMVDILNIGPRDSVVEFAPGLGVTARMTVAKRPYRYTAVERDVKAAEQVATYLPLPNYGVRVADAGESGILEQSASVVYGEALLTMQTPQEKQRIVSEAARLLNDGGVYGIHEVCLVPENIDEMTRSRIQKDLSKAIRVGVRPLTAGEWQDLLTSNRFDIEHVETAPMHLLELGRFLQDEGIGGTLTFLKNAVLDRKARNRVIEMRRVFREHAQHLAAVMIVARKRP